MQLVKFLESQGNSSVALVEHGQATPLDLTGGQYQSLFDVLEADDPANAARFLTQSPSTAVGLEVLSLLAPIDQQEVWAAGVTYRRSRSERMKESQGAARFYSDVYEADRPELFLKATPHRVVGPGQSVRIRQDAKWNVPEPELALVLNSRLELVGYTIGNDMSARDIEGANPLYLPQAKVYEDCCAIGPAITLADAMPSAAETSIAMDIRRGDETVFSGHTSATELARSFADLIDYLGRDNSFPNGVILLTGTGIVPQESFSLARGDVVEITIRGIGTLVNTVVQG